MKTLEVKDPNEEKRYRINWAKQLTALGSDTITGTPTWIYQSGITGGSESNDDTTTTTFLSGGTHGTDYTITCRIDTAGGERLEASIVIPVRDSDK